MDQHAPSRHAAQPTDALLRSLFETSADLPIGFELFPPKSPTGREALMQTVDRLAAVSPEHFSVTMGAGGSSRTGTLETAVTVQRRTGVPVLAHLTALGLDRETIAETADGFWAGGITRVLALRGDVPVGQDPETLPESYDHAADLVGALRARHDFDITVAAYPEKHPEAPSLEADIDHLQEKLDAGASRAMCQFVLNPESYGRFLDACGGRGITAPIVPGVMPLDGWHKIRRFAVSNGTSVPAWLDRLFEHMDANPGLAHLTAMAATLEQMRRLVAYGAPALHVYALNRWEMPLALAHMLGRPVPLPEPAEGPEANGEGTGER